MQDKKQKIIEYIQGEIPEIVFEYEEQETVLQECGGYILQQQQPTGRKNTFEGSITLSDVLRVIELTRGSRYVGQKVGQLLGFEAGDGELYWEPNLGGRDLWDLTKDLNQQSEETISFLHDLLIKTV